MSSPLSVTLAGRSVTLTPLAIDDVPGLVAAASGDRSTFGWSIVPDDVDAMGAVVRRLIAEGDQRTAVPFTTRRSDTAEIIGMTRFLTLRWYFDRDYPDGAEIGGTFLTARAQRTAANTEAKLLMMTHAFDVWGVRRLDLKTDERNDRSRRAIERIGGQFEGVLRNWQAAQVDGEEGRTRNSAIYSILDSEWPGVRERLEARLREN
ncbi:MAG: GNAT family protein [Acidimicrobiales bacterium]